MFISSLYIIFSYYILKLSVKSFFSIYKPSITDATKLSALISLTLDYS